MVEYVMQYAPSSFCVHCDKNLYLLVKKHPNSGEVPVFYICFKCEKVFQAGIGEVEKIEDIDAYTEGES